MSSVEVSTYEFEQLETRATAPANPHEVLEAAWAEADAIRQRAREEGHSEGYAQGLADAQDEAKALTEALSQAARGIAETHAELADRLSADAVELGMTIAEKIVHGALDVQPERVIDVTRGAIRRLSERHRLTVVVNPDDLAVLGAGAEELRAELGGIDHIDLQADRRVGRGGCVVSNQYGEIDASIAIQLQRAREVVAAALTARLDPDADEREPADETADGS